MRIIGQKPVVRITPTRGLTATGAESANPISKPHVLFYKQWLLGVDPPRGGVMPNPRMASFKPWGAR
jgi:hypothetical protein